MCVCVCVCVCVYIYIYIYIYIHAILNLVRGRAVAHGATGRRISPSWWIIEIFLILAMLHDRCNKGCGMYYHVRGVEHIKDTLLIIGKSSPCSIDSGFPLLLSEWSFTVYQTPHNRNIECVE